jgi:hypothetical protein
VIDAQGKAQVEEYYRKPMFSRHVMLPVKKVLAETGGGRWKSHAIGPPLHLRGEYTGCAHSCIPK